MHQVHEEQTALGPTGPNTITPTPYTCPGSHQHLTVTWTVCKHSHPHRGTATQRPVPSAPTVAMRTLGKRCVNNTKEYRIVGNALTCNLAAHPRRNLLRCRAGQSTHWRHRSPLGLGHLRCHDSGGVCWYSEGLLHLYTATTHSLERVVFDRYTQTVQTLSMPPS